MPISFRSEHLIEAPPSEVLAAMTDIDSWPAWMQGLQRVEKLSGGPFGVGTRWRETRRMFGKEASEVFEVVEFEPPRRIGLFVDGAQGTTGKGEFRYVYSLEPASPDSTRLTLDGEIEMPGAMARILGFLLKGVFRKACDRDTRALKAHLEGG
jgi:carbon monoxide dehydrogenase subunit G